MFLKTIPALVKSSSFRFALITVFTIWFATGAVLLLVYFKLDQSLWLDIDANLDSQAKQLFAQIADDPDGELAEFYDSAMQHNHGEVLDQQQLNDMMAMHHSPFMQNLHEAMALASPPKHLLNPSQSLSNQGGQLQFARTVTLPSGEQVILSQDIQYLAQLQSRLWQSLLFGLVATFFLAVASAALLTHKSLGRMQHIHQACQIIAEGNLAYRIPYQHAPERFDDFDKMAQVINQMLDDLNLLLHKVKQVSDDIAHDLKSPLTRMRAKLEMAATTLNAEQLAEPIAEIDRLMAMIKSLLGLARIEAKNTEAFQPIKIADVLGDIAEMYRPAFEDKAIGFTSELSDGQINANPHLLAQAFANLLENALKFTPVQGRVSLTSQRLGERYQISLTDSGPGIAAADIDRVFDRFYRADKARDSAGFGLGLSLVKAIIQLHQGTIGLSSNNGLTVSVSLPLAGK